MKERKVIAFAEGIVTTPSSGKDGELKDCVNLIPVNGELRNIEEPKGSGDYMYNAEDNLLYVHKVLTGERHLIYLSGGDAIYWKTPGEEDNQQLVVRLDNDENVIKVSSMNNVLIVLTDKDLLYFLWKDNAYSAFDTAAGRQLDLRFGLVGEQETSQDGQRIVVTIDSGTVTGYWYNEDNNNVVLGQMHDFVQSAHEHNKFVYPFFVRYALKTKSGQYICPSTPALMIPNTQQAPCPFIDGDNLVFDGDYYARAKFNVRAFVGQLYFKIANSSAAFADIIDSIKDVVDSVVIAVTPPVYTYNDGATETQKKEDMGLMLAPEQYIPTYNGTTDPRGNFGVYSAPESDPDDLKYRKQFGSVVLNEQNVEKYYIVNLAKVDMDAQMKKSDVFRIVKEIPLAEFETMIEEQEVGKFRSVDIDYGYLASLDARPRLNDDPITLQEYLPKTMFEYNSRLHLANVKRSLFYGYPPLLMQGVCDYVLNVPIATRYYAEVEIAKNGESHYVVSECGIAGDGLHWFCYPDRDATSARIFKVQYVQSHGEDRITAIATLPLKEHDTLNCAYWVNELKEMPFFDLMPIGGIDHSIVPGQDGTPLPQKQTSNLFEPHTVLGSETFDPTVLSSDNVINVGKGEIKAVSAISLPISEPFGKTPMVCFCTDGVWGLSLKDDGRFAADQQLSGDILMDGTEPVQSDKAVFFVTEQGLKAFTGGVPELLSGKMEQKVEYGNGSNGSNGANVIFDFLNDVCKAGTKLMWDYAHDFLHIFPDVDVTVWIPTELNPLPSNPTTGQLMYLTEDVTITDTDPVTGDSLSVTYTAGLYKYGTSWQKTTLYEYVYNVRSGQWARKGNRWAPGGIVQAYPVTYLQKVGVTQLYTTERNRENGVPKSGTAVTREEPFGDAAAMKQLIDMRILHLFSNSTSQARVSIQVSNDRYNWYTLTSLRAHSWKWYRFVLTTNMANEEAVQGILAEYETRRMNKLR